MMGVYIYHWREHCTSKEILVYRAIYILFVTKTPHIFSYFFFFLLCDTIAARGLWTHFWCIFLFVHVKSCKHISVCVCVYAFHHTKDQSFARSVPHLLTIWIKFITFCVVCAAALFLVVAFCHIRRLAYTRMNVFYLHIGSTSRRRVHIYIPTYTYVPT